MHTAGCGGDRRGLSVGDGDTGPQPTPDPALPPHLQHGAILEDVLLITHHAVLIERRDPLLCVLHDLRGSTEGVRPCHSHGAWGDAPGSGMGMSGTVVSGEDETGSGVWISGMWGTGEDVLGSGMGLSGTWNSEKDTLGIRIRTSRTWGSGENAPDSRMWISGKWASRGECSGQQDEDSRMQDSPGRGSRTPAWGCSCSGLRPVTEPERSQLRYPLSHRQPQLCMARAAPALPSTAGPQHTNTLALQDPDIPTCPSTARPPTCQPLPNTAGPPTSKYPQHRPLTCQHPQHSGTPNRPSLSWHSWTPDIPTAPGKAGHPTCQHSQAQQDPQHANIPWYGRDAAPRVG